MSISIIYVDDNGPIDDAGLHHFQGLSTDTKGTGSLTLSSGATVSYKVGSTFSETDTGVKLEYKGSGAGWLVAGITEIPAGKVHTLLDSVTETGAGSVIEMPALNATFQAIANGTSGAFSATVEVQFSNDNVNWETGITFNLSGTATTADSDGNWSSEAWKYVRGNVTAISGTGAYVDLYMGV